MNHSNLYKAIFFLLFFILHHLSYSCPVCRGGISKTEQDAYVLTIVILGSLPLLMAGGLFLWIYRRYRRAGNQG